MPLCAIHHHHIHTTGKEREWWQEQNIDPLVIASRLWQQSREHYDGPLKEGFQMGLRSSSADRGRCQSDALVRSDAASIPEP